MTQPCTPLHRRSLLAGLGAAAAVGVVGCSASGSDDPPAVVGERPGGYQAGTQLDNLWGLPDTPVQASDGTTTSLAALAGEVTIVFFGYVNCPDVCTGILADLASAKQRLSEADRAKVRVVFVTTDPARDTPAAIKTYLDRIDPGFIGVTADLSVISAIASSMSIQIEQGTKLPSGGYEVEHSSQVLGFGSNKKAQVLWSEGTTVANYKDDFATLISHQS